MDYEIEKKYFFAKVGLMLRMDNLGQFLIDCCSSHSIQISVTFLGEIYIKHLSQNRDT